MVLLLLLPFAAAARTAVPVLFLLVLPVLLRRTLVGLTLVLLSLVGISRPSRTISSLTSLSTFGRPKTSSSAVILLVPLSSLQTQLNIIYTLRQPLYNAWQQVVPYEPTIDLRQYLALLLL